MYKEFDTLAKYTLTKIMEGSLSNGIVNEFTEFCCKCVQQSVQPDWTGNVAELWDYLTVCRTLPESEYPSASTAFHMGRLYASLELLHMLQEKREAERTLKEDAHFYSGHWRNVFTSLGNGNSLTHRKLAEKSNLSDSSLSQFLHKIEEKNYIHFRKVGHTKYYRLTSRGQLLLKHIAD